MSNLNLILGYILARLREPSSYGGLGLILASTHICKDCSGLAQALVPVFVSLAGLIAFILPQAKAK